VLTCLVIRFNVNAEVQHHADALNNAVEWFINAVKTNFGSPFSIARTLLVALIAWSIFSVMFRKVKPVPAPDLAKLSAVAKSYEPMIFYAGTGPVHIMEMSDTSIAVWDLGETVRSANLTSGTMISSNLEELGNNLQTLALEMSKFFASVDGDLDT
jgi:hypothetical protein